MGASSSVDAVLVWSAIGGVGNGACGMARLTALQERTPAIHQACVNALYETAMSLAPGLGFVAGDVVAGAASPRAFYLVAGVGALVAVVVSSARLRHADWSPVPLVATDRGR
jgi:hypothetical protein